MFPAPENLVVREFNNTHKEVRWDSVATTSNINYKVCTNVSECENTSMRFYLLVWSMQAPFKVIVKAVNDTCTGESATSVYEPSTKPKEPYEPTNIPNNEITTTPGKGCIQ